MNNLIEFDMQIIVMNAGNNQINKPHVHYYKYLKWIMKKFKIYLDEINYENVSITNIAMYLFLGTSLFPWL